MPSHLLTHLKIKNAKPKTKPYKLFDGRGLYIYVFPNGSKYWRYKYRYNGKEKTYSIGIFPEVSLQEARDKHMEARKMLNSGQNPMVHKKLNSNNQNTSFLYFMNLWLDREKNAWSQVHYDDVVRSLNRDVVPMLKSYDVRDITKDIIISIVNKIQDRGAYETAQRNLQRIGTILSLAETRGVIAQNPAWNLKSIIHKKKKGSYRYLPAEKLGEFLRDLHHSSTSIQIKWGFMIFIHTFVRTSELIKAKWEEIDFENNQWIIPAERMKMEKKHIVPLTKQTKLYFSRLKELSAGDSDYVLPSYIKKGESISNNTFLASLRRLGYNKVTTVHGFRAMASTWLNSQGWYSDFIEKQLSHNEKDKSRAAYNHSDYIPERVRMLHAWSDFVSTQYNRIELEDSIS